MKSVAIVCLLSLVAFVYSQNYAQIGTFEGTYDDVFYGGNLYICVNGEVLQGQYSEVGIMNGVISPDGQIVTGKFFQAGINDCNVGTFTLTLTDEGFTGFYTCNGVAGDFAWDAKKYDVFRPTDDQCALLYDGDGSVQGHWTLHGAHDTIDVCIRSGTVDDDYTIHASYNTENNGEVYPNVAAITGYYLFDKKILVGTWYQDFVGGAVLGFVNNRQQLVLYFWTGLVGRQGASIIDLTELHVPDYHHVATYENSQKTAYAQCDRYQFLVPYLLEGLYYYQNEDYAYFVYNPDFQLNIDAGFDPIDYKDTNYYLIISANSSSYVTISALAVVFALLAFF